MLRDFIKDYAAWMAAFIGLSLMVLTLYFDVNPIEGSVVAREIAGTWIHFLLFVTCMPAWIAGLFLSMIVPLPFAVMACLSQILLYFLVGKVVRRSFTFLFGGTRAAGNVD
jgi:hypothetical protein